MATKRVSPRPSTSNSKAIQIKAPIAKNVFWFLSEDQASEPLEVIKAKLAEDIKDPKLHELALYELQSLNRIVVPMMVTMWSLCMVPPRAFDPAEWVRRYAFGGFARGECNPGPGDSIGAYGRWKNIFSETSNRFQFALYDPCNEPLVRVRDAALLIHEAFRRINGAVTEWNRKWGVSLDDWWEERYAAAESLVKGRNSAAQGGGQ